jgi:hypothetical protein
MNGYVISNTNNTLTCFDWAGPPINWTTGQQYQIHKVLIALDQPTRGQGDLVIGDTPVNSTTGTPAWPNQLRDPCYSWNNVYQPDGSTINFVVEIIPALVQGLDYFSDTPMPGYMPYTYPHPLVTGGGPTPTPTPTPTSTPTANQCEVPNLIGTHFHHAQDAWNWHGFTTEVIILPHDGIWITWQSLPAGFIGSCSDTTISVE